MTRDTARAGRHRERAEKFYQHANSTKNPDTRRMYLRLARSEEALAERAERSAESLKNFSKG
jgi:rubrerythrin